MTRRLSVEPLEDRRLLAVGLGLGNPPSAIHCQALADLSVAAQHAISSAIGQDQSAYHAVSGAAGATLTNPANGFTAEVQSGALHVVAGLDTWDMSLEGFGYGEAVQPVGTAQISVNGNRVDCDYGTINEWYVNGPGGLEQGFVVAPPPQSDASGLLTVELALSGDLRGTVSAAGDGLMLSRSDGSAALGYTGLVAYDATGKTLPAWLEVQAEGSHQDLLIYVDDAGAQGPITIDPFVQEAKLTASDGAEGDMLGFSVAISGDTVLVGATSATVGASGCEGAAYVFTRSGSGWANMTQTAKLRASDGGFANNFGHSVAISGDTVVVGARSATVGGNSGQGAAYVFVKPGSGWENMTQTAKLTASDGAEGDEFGWSVANTGDTVVVGAQWATIGDNTWEGAAYVFAKPGSGWASMTETGKLSPSDGEAFDYFGTSVSISGNTIVVNALNSNQRGSVYVFTKPGSGWTNMTESAKLTPGGTMYDCFGGSVSISGDTVVAGGSMAGVDGNVGQGAAYVFVKPGSVWANMTYTAKLTASDGAWGDLLGNSVSISGDTVVVGAHSADSGLGAAYVFTKPGFGWTSMTETAKLTASDTGMYDEFGWSVSVSGNTVVVGAYMVTIGYNYGQGAAYVFGTSNGTSSDAIGTFSSGYWRCDVNRNLVSDSGDGSPLVLGWNGATPVTGDWNGDGTDEIGVYAGGAWYLDANGNETWDGSGGGDVFLYYGWSGATPVVGDWNGDGTDDVGVYNLGVWFRDVNGNRQWDSTDASSYIYYGWSGAIPVVGNWNGDGVDDVGIYNLGGWFRDVNGSNSWDSADQSAFMFYGWNGPTPVSGDWNGDGSDNVGVYAGGSWLRDVNGSNTWDSADQSAVAWFGSSSQLPVVGVWPSAGYAIQASSPPAVAQYAGSPLTNEELQPIVTEAIARWAVVGLEASILDKLARVEFVIADLPSSYLGKAEVNRIYIDSDAAGYGWFVDPTPAYDEEFMLESDCQLSAIDPRAVDRIDLLTVVEHELGHIAGLDDLDALTHDLMSAVFREGIRWNPH